MGVPAAAVYKFTAIGIVDDWEKLREKAESELTDSRMAKGYAKHNFGMLAQYWNGMAWLLSQDWAKSSRRVASKSPQISAIASLMGSQFQRSISAPSRMLSKARERDC